MRTNRAVTGMSSERVAVRPIVDRQTPVKTLPSFAVGNSTFNNEMLRYLLQNLNITAILKLHSEQAKAKTHSLSIGFCNDFPSEIAFA